MQDKIIDIANEVNTRTIPVKKIDQMIELLQINGINSKKQVLEILKDIRKENKK